MTDSLSVDVVRSRVDAVFPEMLNKLAELVAIPSVSSVDEHAGDVVRSAEYVRDALRAIGLQADIFTAPTPSGQEGKPAVVAHSARVEGAPTVLLYAHHDVQPVGDVSRWSSDPYVAQIRGDRMFGRGASDDGAGIIVHLGALTALGSDLGVNVVVFIEGEEEIGSPSFTAFLEKYKEQLQADVIVVADSDNWKVGEPALTTSLRGNVLVTVDVTTADHAVHSGMFGGPIVDSVILAAQLISSLHDENGDVAIAGLGGNPKADVVWPEDEFRQAAGLVDSYELAGTADLAAQAWTMPAITVIGFDATPVVKASNTLSPHTRFRLSMRTVPGVDPAHALSLLEAHLLANVPCGAKVELSDQDCGDGYLADVDSPVTKMMHEVLSEAWGVPSVSIGVGGSIPFISDFQKSFPNAQVLVTGVEDPMTNAHSEDESQSISDLRCAIVAEVLMLQRLAQGI